MVVDWDERVLRWPTRLDQADLLRRRLWHAMFGNYLWSDELVIRLPD